MQLKRFKTLDSLVSMVSLVPLPKMTFLSPESVTQQKTTVKKLQLELQTFFQGCSEILL